MKLKLLDKLIMLSKLSIYGLVAQCILFSSIWAEDIRAQRIKSVSDVSVELNINKARLEKVFRYLESQTDFYFSYSKEDIDQSVNYSYTKGEQLKVRDVLLDISQRSKLRFRQVNRNIIVQKQDESASPVSPIEIVIDDIEITGKVVDENGEPLPGVSILEKGTTNGTVTGIDGTYNLKASNNGVLIFSFVSYVRQEVPVDMRTAIDVQMQLDTQQLEELVVVGFGVQKKISVVGAVSTVEPEQLRIPTANISNALAGNLAGIIAVQRTGQPGADGSSFFIRGISTFSGVQNPLILLDGVEISPQDLNSLAPEVIESVSVLKDATATAIYGTRGANGVLIVTTKNGQDLDKPKIYTRMQYQVSMPTSVPKFVDGVEYMELFNEAVTQRGTGEILYSKEKINGTRQGLDPYIYPNVDWYDELFNDAAYNQEANVNIQGGGRKVGYFMSATVNKSTGILKKFDLNSYDNNLSVRKFSFQNNINADISPTTKLSLKLNTQLRYQDGPANSAQSVFGNVMNANPADFPLHFPLDRVVDPRDILYGGKSGGTINDGFPNPFALMTNGYNNNFQSTVLATIDGEQKLDFITEGLKFKALVSFKNWSSTSIQRSRGYNQYQISSIDGDDYELQLIGSPQNLSLVTSPSTAGDRRLYMQPSIEYSNSFGDHNVSGLLLYNQTEYVNNTPGDFINSLAERRQGYAGRMTYDYDNRWMVEANFGYNGSENFAKGHRFGFFPSFAGGYVISRESFFAPLTNTINFMKLRASWGKVGNDRIGGARFPYLSNIDLNGRGYTTGREQNTSYSGPTYLQFANENITWEVAEKLNLGIDVGLFDHFNMVFEVYRENRKNIFVDVSSTIPNVFGTANTSVYSNIGEVVNKGIDFSMEFNRHFDNGLEVSSKGTFTFARNKILKNNEPAFTKYRNLSAVGHPINTPLGYLAERLFIDQAEVDFHSRQQLGGFVSAGDIKYTDVTNDIDGLNLINSDDRVRMGFPTVPEIVYGLSTTLKYKDFDFSFLLQGVERTSFFINNFHPFGSFTNRNVLQFIADDHYSESNPDIYAAYPKLSKLDNGNNTQNSSYWLRDGSFLKLRSAEIGYSYKFGRLFLSGYNLLTFSKFKHWDPEQGGGNGLQYPTQTVINLGLQMRFN